MVTRAERYHCIYSRLQDGMREREREGNEGPGTRFLTTSSRKRVGSFAPSLLFEFSMFLSLFPFLASRTHFIVCSIHAFWLQCRHATRVPGRAAVPCPQPQAAVWRAERMRRSSHRVLFPDPLPICAAHILSSYCFGSLHCVPRRFFRES